MVYYLFKTCNFFQENLEIVFDGFTSNLVYKFVQVHFNSLKFNSNSLANLGNLKSKTQMVPKNVSDFKVRSWIFVHMFHSRSIFILAV